MAKGEQASAKQGRKAALMNEKNRSEQEPTKLGSGKIPRAARALRAGAERARDKATREAPEQNRAAQI